MDNNLSVIILSAGKSKRMHTDIPKVLHKIAGKTIIEYVVDSVKSLCPQKIITVVGYKRELVMDLLTKKYKGIVDFAPQKEQLGTAHAVMCAEEKLKDFNGDVLILYGDILLFTSAILKKFIKFHRSAKSTASILTAELPSPSGYGRIIRDAEGKILYIIEEKDANSEQKKIKEINTGIYCLNKNILFKYIKYIENNNKQKEYYLTDIIKFLTYNKHSVFCFKIQDYTNILGINTKEELEIVSNILKNNILKKLMKKGVLLIDTASTWIDFDVKINQDTIIYPNVIIEGKTKIGKKNIIGPNTRIIDSEINNNNSLIQSYIENCKIGNNCKIGPYARIRPQTIICDGVKIGNFVELKNSKIGKNSQVNHLSYIGDATVGKNTNIGAGTITCNYDGIKKHHTIIGNNSFVGSNTILVAPVKIGNFSYTAAGSVITKDIPDYSLGIGREKQVNIDGWTKRRRLQQKKIDSGEML